MSTPPGPPQQVQVDPERVAAGLRAQLRALGEDLGRRLGDAYARIAEQDAIITQLVLDAHAPPTEPDGPPA